ncbi:ATP-dependent 6-phosphofructokinase [uncultured Paludibaculum sp.]|uniref:ATP-dependent 6-phosphofructokinase n=1 Tax=uncultured Paludibaculum sp. TaxID=1765020 RepID=UPI002AAB4133|nr:ATP-dependent 6-phosphofructokinase [uncultured Paludibaculum sp.]
MTPRTVAVDRLGDTVHPSPLKWNEADPEHPNVFVRDSEFIPLQITVDVEREREGNLLFEKAGPREQVFFDASKTRAAIVTCGGLCPGLNNVIRSLVLSLRCHYGVERVLGIRYGYHGLNPAHGFPPMELDVDDVSDIHEVGGTIIGTSRGPEDAGVMLDFLRTLGVQMLFTIGGDGTQRGAMKLHEEARRQGYPLAVVGVPKTVDNDIQYVTRTFGFGTAVDRARAIIDVAHTEARAVLNGVGLVRLMGRDSGFIAAGATLASGEVNYCLIPEQQFAMEGERGLLAVLQKRLARKRHAVIVVAEGAGQALMAKEGEERDASGNVKFADIGVYLKDHITAHFKGQGQTINVRYIDPSYAIRGLAANTEDAVLCDMLARNAAHAAMAGRSGVIVGYIHNRMVHVPMELATNGRKKVGLESALWKGVLAVTGQPASWK